MAVVPLYQVVQNETCDGVSIYDITGVYDASSNTTGWGTPNDDTDDIVSAEVKIYNYDGDLLDTVDLLSLYPASATESILLQEYPWAEGDGYYRFEFFIESASILPPSEGVPNYEVESLFLCETKTAVDRIWIRVFEDGSCHCNEKIKKEAIRAEVIYRSMKANEAEISSANINKLMQLADHVQDIADNLCLD